MKFIRACTFAGLEIVLLLLVGLLAVGEEQSHGVHIGPTLVSVTSTLMPTQIDKNEAIRILKEEILPDVHIPRDFIAFGYHILLAPGDELSPYAPDPIPPSVTSLPHLQPYVLDRVVWFFWIDLAPYAKFSHPTRFVLIDASDGSYVVYDEGWWPVLNGRSLWTRKEDYWDKDNWVIARLLAIQGDYGDAPEGQNTGYSSTVIGGFPTLYDEGMPPGHYVIHRFPLEKVFLGDITKGDTATEEPDGRVVNQDVDDGVMPADLLQCAEQRLDFEVTVQPDAPKGEKYYFNLLFDWDHNGVWQGYVSCPPTENFPTGRADEWAIRNLRLDQPPYNVGPGFHGLVTTPAFLTGSDPEGLWIRATISTQPVDETVHISVDQGGLGWDGSGYFLYGETEDYFWPFEPGPLRPVQPPPPTVDIDKGECALVVNGWAPDETGEDDFKEDENGMSSVFQSAGINTTTLGPGVASPQAMEAAIRNLAASGCTELVVYITCHGSPNAVWIGGQRLSATDLARMLRLFPGNVYVLIDACHSGSFIPTLSALAHVRKVKTACDTNEYSYFDLDPPNDPNPNDKGGEWTSGYREDLEELLHPDKFQQSVMAPAEEQALPFKDVLLNKGFETAVQKDAAAINGLSHPQEYHVPRVLREEKDPLMECVELLAKSTRREYKGEGSYTWYKSQYRRKKCKFFLNELEIYKDSPYVSERYRRCARDLLQADWENYCEPFWDIFAR